MWWCGCRLCVPPRLPRRCYCIATHSIVLLRRAPSRRTLTSFRTMAPALVATAARCCVMASVEGRPTYSCPGANTSRKLCWQCVCVLEAGQTLE